MLADLLDGTAIDGVIYTSTIKSTPILILGLTQPSQYQITSIRTEAIHQIEIVW